MVQFFGSTINPQVQINQLFALSVLDGAILWVMLATRFGLPVSTTHAIVGSIILTAVYAFGFESVFWSSVTKKVALPLLLSPVAAFGLSLLTFRGLFWLCRKKYCLNCHWAHWMSAMSSGFARGLGADAFSAGSKPSGKVNETAVALMCEKGISLTSHRSKSIQELPPGKWDCVVTMGCGDACPHVPAKKRVDWAIPDPKGLPLDEFRRVLDIIAAVTPRSTT